MRPKVRETISHWENKHPLTPQDKSENLEEFHNAVNVKETKTNIKFFFRKYFSVYKSAWTSKELLLFYLYCVKGGCAHSNIHILHF